MNRLLPAAALLGLAVLPACGARSGLLDDDALLFGAGGFGAGGRANGDDAGTPPDDPGHDDPCGAGLKGPWMVPVTVPIGGSFCIDATEVTRWQYAAFLAAGVDVTAQPAICAWNDDYVPGAWDVQTRDDAPVVGVDWCDARAYCVWAGKRFCGRIGGGSLDLDQSTEPATSDAATSEWTYACSAGGARAYPYGDTYDPTACVTSDALGFSWDQVPAFSFKPVASFPGCVGGFPGIYDMSGNVYEWEDIEATVDGIDVSGIRGGCYESLSYDSACDYVGVTVRDSNSLGVGIRCCKDAPP